MSYLELELLVNQMSPSTAARLDLLRDIGPRAALRQWRANRRHAMHQRRTAVAVAEGMWREAALAIGADFRTISNTTYEFRRGSARAFVDSQTTPLADPVSQKLADDKPLAYDLLSEAGVPVPTRVVVSSDAHTAGARFAEEVGGPVLVKPARGFGGAGDVRAARAEEGSASTDESRGRAGTPEPSGEEAGKERAQDVPQGGDLRGRRRQAWRNAGLGSRPTVSSPYGRR